MNKNTPILTKLNKNIDWNDCSHDTLKSNFYWMMLEINSYTIYWQTEQNLTNPKPCPPQKKTKQKKNTATITQSDYS